MHEKASLAWGAERSATGKGARPFCIVRVLPFVAMAVSPELLKILVCPLDKAALVVTANGQGLKCSECRRVYPVRDDIPVMLVSEAKIED